MTAQTAHPGRQPHRGHSLLGTLWPIGVPLKGQGSGSLGLVRAGIKASHVSLPCPALQPMVREETLSSEPPQGWPGMQIPAPRPQPPDLLDQRLQV